MIEIILKMMIDRVIEVVVETVSKLNAGRIARTTSEWTLGTRAPAGREALPSSNVAESRGKTERSRHIPAWPANRWDRIPAEENECTENMSQVGGVPKEAQ